MLHKEDYQNANFPMLPNTSSEKETIRYIAIYSCSTLLMSLLAAPILQLSLIYLFIAILLGIYLMFNVLNLYQNKISAESFFSLSDTYLALLFLGIVIDILWTLRLVEI
jgi:protoheme IX farnesyltransferase